MKKFYKIMTVISAILAVAGIVFIIIGVSLGGIDTIAERVSDSKLPFINIGIDDFSDEGMDKILDKSTFTKDEVKNIVFKGKYGVYQFREWTNDDIAVMVENASSKIKYSVSDNTLNIVDNKNKNFWNTKKQSRITVYIPTGYKLDGIKIRIGAGSVAGSSINSGTLDIDIGAGEGIFDNINTDSFNISVGAGEADVTDCIIGKSNIKVGMGELDLTGMLSQNADIECGVGDVSLKLKNNYTDFNYVLNVGAGDIEIDNKTYGGLSNSTTINNNSNLNMNINCGMGSVSVENVN